jgi:hypothetical protein
METTLQHIELALWILLGSAWFFLLVIGKIIDNAAEQRQQLYRMLTTYLQSIETDAQRQGRIYGRET